MTTTWSTVSGAVVQSVADAAATSATAAAADVVLTNADVVLTNADVVLTNADVVLTNADVVSTNADVVSTNADVVSTNADVVLTTADVATTTADVVSTTADVVSTAADLVQTDLDVTATAASAAAGATSATNAATSETNASGSATAAATSATASATSASASASSSTSAATQATNSATSATASAASLTSFQSIYHGALSTAPSTGVSTGDLYFDTASGVDAMKVYDGSVWAAAYISAAGMLVGTNNLSDVSNAGSSRTNLGLGSMAEQAHGSVNIDGGAIDGTVIGAASAVAGTFTNLTMTGTLLATAASAKFTPASGDVDIRIVNKANDATGRLYFGDSDSETAAALIYYHGANAMAFQANAGERMRITSTEVSLGEDLIFSQATPEIRGGDADGELFIAPSTTNALGGNVVLYSQSHASKANDIEFRATAATELGYDDSASTWNFAANTIRTTGGLTVGLNAAPNYVAQFHSAASHGLIQLTNAATGSAGGDGSYIGVINTSTTLRVWNQEAAPIWIGSDSGYAIFTNGAATFAGDINFSQATPEILGGDADGELFIGPSTTNALGGNLVLYSQSHASKANDIEFRSGGTVETYYDDSGSTWDFAANRLLTTGNVTAAAGTFSSHVTLNSATPTLYVGSSAVSTGAAFTKIGAGRTGSGISYLDLIGDATYTDYGTRLYRDSASGANSYSALQHRGTGAFLIQTIEAAPIDFYTTNALRLTISAAGGADFNNNEASQITLKDYAEKVNVIGGSGGGTQDFNLTLGNVASVTVDTSANTFTFSNPSASGTTCSLTLIITNGASQTLNWPSSVDWAGGTAPTLTASGVDVLTFLTIDGGTIWYGFVGGLAMA